MKANVAYSSVSPVISVILLVLASFILAGCANTVVYQHTTSVKASAEELDVRVLGFVSDVHVKDGSVELAFTTIITLGNEVK